MKDFGKSAKPSKVLATAIYAIVFGLSYLVLVSIASSADAVGPCLSGAGLIGVSAALIYLSRHHYSTPDWVLSLVFATMIAPIPGFLTPGFLTDSALPVFGFALVTTAIVVWHGRVVISCNC